MSLRGTEEPDLFNFVVAGKNINHAELANNPDQLRKVFMENTGNREDLKFGECPWISYYTSVLNFLSSSNSCDIYIRLGPISGWWTNLESVVCLLQEVRILITKDQPC